MKLFKNDRFPVLFVTLYLIIYTSLSYLKVYEHLIPLMFFLSPLFVIWMVYSVLKYGKPARDLKEGEEFGYSDLDDKK